MGKKSKPTRRKFIKTAAAGALAFNYFSHPIYGKNAPSNKLNIAAIGVGGMGRANLKQLDTENIVALCDVDSKYSGHAFRKYSDATPYKDYRVMFDKQKDFDAVMIATPDHTHAVITMLAMQMGKHVYCQKPLTHTIYEARKITEAARYFGVQTQMGNQGHSSEEIRRLKEYVEDGAIGNVTHVYGWTDRPVGGNPWSDFAVKAISKDTPPTPETLDWDLWLGPVKHRPFHPDYHPTKWRAWLDFGTGAMGDMGCHILDPSFWALDLGAPTTVQGSSTHWEPDVASQTFPRASVVRMQFPARGEKPPVKLEWSDGRLMPPIPPELDGVELPPSGAFLVGEKGVILHGSHGASSMKVYPESLENSYTPPAKKYRRVDGSHEQDWVRACKDGTPASSTFDYGGPLTEMALLGMVGIQMKDKLLMWDSENLRFTNSDAANELLHIDYREGWTLE